MDQLLGLYTSPNSLQLPPGATLKAENVYLDTDGYFKPFKKIERAFSYANLLQSFITPLSIWGTAVNLKFFSVKGRLLVLAVDANHGILGFFAPDQNGVFQEISNPEYVQVAKETFGYLASTSNVFYPSIEYGKLLLIGLVSGLPSFFNQAGLTAFKLDGDILTVKTSCPPLGVATLTYTLPPSRVYDGDPANNPTNAVRECLISIASPGVVTLANHNIEPDTAIQFQTTGTLPTGITAGATYYVLSTGITTNTFRFSSSIGGAAVNTSGSQTGTQSVISTDADQLYANAYRFTLSGQIDSSLVESKPTGSLYVRGRNGILPPSIWMELFSLMQATSSNATTSAYVDKLKFNVYRTNLEFASISGITPRESDDYRLIKSSSITPFTTIEYEDTTIMPPGSAELYTNAARDGIIKQNEQVFGHLTSSLYKGYAFYGNVIGKSSVVLDVTQSENGRFSGAWFIKTGTGGSAGIESSLPNRYLANFADPSTDTNFTTGLFYGQNGFGFSATYSQSGATTLTVNTGANNHNLTTGDYVFLTFTNGAQTNNDWYVVNVTAPNLFTVSVSNSLTTSGGVQIDYLKGCCTNSLALRDYFVAHLNTSGTGAKIIVQSRKIGQQISVIHMNNPFVRSATVAATMTPGVYQFTCPSHGVTGSTVFYLDSLFVQTSGWVTGATNITTNTFEVAVPWTYALPTSVTLYRGTIGTNKFFTNIDSTGILEAESAVEPSKIYYSKFQQPYSLTLDQNFPVGSDGEILYLANLREYLLIFKTDGVYILRGETEEEFTIDPLYPQLQLLDSQAIQIIDDYVIGLFSIGVVRLNENGYEIISQPIRDDIQYMIDAVTPEGVVIEEPPIVFYQKSKRLVFIGRKKNLVEPAENEDLPFDYKAHDAFVYHLDSKQWTKSTKINLDGAVEIDGEIYFPGIPNAPTEVEVSLGVDYTFTTDIFKTSSSLLPTAYTTDFAIRFVKKMQTPDGKSGNYRYLKIHFREMNLTSIKVRYYLNYNFENGDDFFEETYDDIVTFEEDGSIASSRYMCYLYIPTEAARGNWLSFEIFGATNSGVGLKRYNGILVEGVDLVTSPGRSDTV